jgi:hypothetical protein
MCFAKEVCHIGTLAILQRLAHCLLVLPVAYLQIMLDCVWWLLWATFL